MVFAQTVEILREVGEGIRGCKLNIGGCFENYIEGFKVYVHSNRS